jgi:hypothetical protein
MLAKVSTPEFVEKFNRDRAVMNAIKGVIHG